MFSCEFFEIVKNVYFEKHVKDASNGYGNEFTEDD